MKALQSKHIRSSIILGLLLIMGAIVIYRLFTLQVADHGFYKALARGQQTNSAISHGERGNIFIQDKDGNQYLVATTRQIPYVFTTPVEIPNKDEAAPQLASILDLDLPTTRNLLDSNDNFHVVLKKSLSEEEHEAIRQLEIPGIYIGFEKERYYPHGTLAAHVLGFVNQDGKGQYGVEGYYDDQLEGKEGLKTLVTNPASYLLSLFENTNPNGTDIILTLDFNIQAKAEELLNNAAAELSADGGTIIIMEPREGKILAMASTPTFDPNNYSEVSDFSIFQNPAHQKIYEPGSVFKALTMAGALEAGAITPSTTYTDEGSITIQDRTLSNYDHRNYGLRTMTEVLEFSINTGSVFAQQQLGAKKFLSFLEQLELFKPTNVDLAGEVSSSNQELKRGYEVNYATASFGQGIEITPIQLMKAYTALTNSGTMVNPYLGEWLIPSQGEKKQSEHAKNPEGETVISSKTASQTTAMLTSVIENGYGKAAHLPGYYVAGKTGTAQVSYSALGIHESGYSDKTIQSFIGYAPAFNPRYIILVKLDNPSTRTSEYSAVPVFKELNQYLITYLGIPPDYEK